MSDQSEAVELIAKVLGGKVIDPNRCEFPKCKERGHEYGYHGVWCIRHRKVMVPGSFLNAMKERGELPGGAS